MTIDLILKDSRQWKYRSNPLECACRTRVEKPKTPRAQRSLREEQWSHVLDERVANEFHVLSLARLEYVLLFDWSMYFQLSSTALPSNITNNTEDFSTGIIYPPPPLREYSAGYERNESNEKYNCPSSLFLSLFLADKYKNLTQDNKKLNV